MRGNMRTLNREYFKAVVDDKERRQLAKKAEAKAKAEKARLLKKK